MLVLAVPPLPTPGQPLSGSPDPSLTETSSPPTGDAAGSSTWAVLYQRLPPTLQSATPTQPVRCHERTSPTAGPRDDELIAAIQAGDHDALAALYDRYGRQCFAVAYRVLDDGGAAEDAVQDAFLALWRQAASFRPERGAVRTWLLAIVRNAAVDRRRGRHARPLGDVPLADVESRLATGDDDTFEIVESTLVRDRIRTALAVLPVEQRRAIELAFFHGLTHHEIAEQTGLPLGTVKGRLRLGLVKLRALLAAPESCPTRPVAGAAA